MFTGLIQTLGTLQALRDYELKITCAGPHADRILQDLELGDSIAVDGVCLTVAEILPQGFIKLADAHAVEAFFARDWRMEVVSTISFKK